MASSSDLIQDVYAKFANLYATATAQGRVLIAFEPLGLAPGIDPAAPGAQATALEFLSSNADALPDLSASVFVPTGRTVSGVYNTMLESSMPGDGTSVSTFNVTKANAKELYENAKFGSQLGAFSYMPAFATPVSWYDPSVENNWFGYSYQAGQTQQTVPPPPSQLRVRMLDAPAWRFTMNPTPAGATPVPALATHLMAAAPAVRDPANLWRLPTVMNTRMLVLNNTSAQPVLQPEFSLTFEYCLVQLRRPWLSGEFLAFPAWYVPGYHAGDLALVPAEVVATPSTSTESPSTPTTAHVLPPFSWVPVACIAVKNLVISSSNGGIDPEVAAGTTAFGPFAIEPRQNGSDGLKHTGIQVIAWICSAQPELPPATDPALVPPTHLQTTTTIIDTAVDIFDSLASKFG